MCTGLLYQNWIRNFYISIGCPIGTSSKLYEDNQTTIKRVSEDIITTQDITIDVLINALHAHHLQKIFEMADTISNIKLAYLKSKQHSEKILIDLIDNVIGVCFYPPPG